MGMGLWRSLIFLMMDPSIPRFYINSYFMIANIMKYIDTLHLAYISLSYFLLV